jgi:hypothetical protein
VSDKIKEIADGDRQTCEYVIEWGDTPGKALTFCGTPATQRYPAMGGGFMHLCDEHSIKHLNYTEPVAR